MCLTQPHIVTSATTQKERIISPTTLQLRTAVQKPAEKCLVMHPTEKLVVPEGRLNGLFLKPVWKYGTSSRNLIFPYLESLHCEASSSWEQPCVNLSSHPWVVLSSVWELSFPCRLWPHVGCSFDDPQMISQCLSQAAQVLWLALATLTWDC